MAAHGGLTGSANQLLSSYQHKLKAQQSLQQSSQQTAPIINPIFTDYNNRIERKQIIIKLVEIMSCSLELSPEQVVSRAVQLQQQIESQITAMEYTREVAEKLSK